MGAKQWVQVDMKTEIIDTRDSKSGAGKSRGRIEKTTYQILCSILGDGFTRNPNSSITQYTHVKNLHMYAPNLKLKIKIRPFLKIKKYTYSKK